MAILDLDLLDGDGMTLERELVRRDAAMRIAICSGRHQRLQSIRTSEPAILAVLTKPVSMDELK